ncbi:MAG TPA: type ISP restriction/modification enzyme [Solirubrobacterales bacterium]|jgi:hypothetical protein
MSFLARYLSEMTRIRDSGEASDETSYYPALSELLNSVGATLDPAVHCVLTPKNRGAGIPDGALFLARSGGLKIGMEALETRAPERGVTEVKGLKQKLKRVADTDQVHRYLERYGQVLVTNYREFLLVRMGPEGVVIPGEPYSLADSEETFWALKGDSQGVMETEAGFEQFLRRALLADAPLSSPEDLACFLAAYARIARERIDAAGELRSLDTLRTALEDALGLRFEGDDGRDFFHSALVQTLFYGVFASWVDWSGKHAPDSPARFSWQTAQWTLNVPMVRVLFEQLATPRNLPAGLDEVLDWTEDVFARVDHEPFFERFERREAVQYFYEHFLQAYDPDLRRELGVWYTPPEVVRYMVAHVHEALKRDLDVPLGLADERVHVLDPCTGTGSFLVEALRTAAAVLEEEHGDTLVAQHAKEAALQRFHGFEVLPAPFIITHLQLGLLLAELGAPLDASAEERPSVFLTNALTGWVGDDETLLLPFEEFRTEREAAGSVKRTEPILVVLGNPPYNGFTGVSEINESDLLLPYKEGLSDPPWEVTKNKLDDYYVRFFRVAERRIAEQTGRGVICFISNFGWLGDPSTVLMRQHLMRAFDHAYVDNLNGDSRETGKKTPDGKPDPSVFSSKVSPSGIQVGTAITLLVRTDDHKDGDFETMYRDFWGATKLADLEGSLEKNQEEPHYEQLSPNEKNWYRLRRWNPRPGYEAWPKLTELAAARADLGLNENRGEALMDLDRDALECRMRHFLDEKKTVGQLDPDVAEGLLQPWAEYDAAATREQILENGGFDIERLKLFQTKPFDVRWAYIDPTAKLWNRPRPQFLETARVGSDFLLFRKRSPRALDGAAFMLSRHLVDQHVLHKDAYAVPLLLAEEPMDDDADRLFPVGEVAHAGLPWRPNLSQLGLDYLAEFGYDDVETSRSSARLIWLHALAIGYSPLYLEENGDAIRNDWPRVPLPITRDYLEDSASLGARIAGLLDIDTPLPGLDTSASDRLQSIASIEHKGGGPPPASDLDLTAGWGHAQIRKQKKSGAISRIVMPGTGVIVRRPRTAEEHATLSASQLDLLGDTVVDVYLNDKTYWRGVPETVWSFKVGGFQVLRKWLSYRESVILGRPLTFVEIRQFRSIARRLTELVLMGPALDANYRAATGSVDQDPLPELTALELRV